MPLDLSVDEDAVKSLAILARSISLEGFPDRRPSLPASTTREEAAAYLILLYAVDYGLEADDRRRLSAALWDLVVEGGGRPSELAGINGARLSTIAGRSGVRLPDPELRAMLLRDIAIKVRELYSGSYYAIVVESHGMLRHKNGGFLDRIQDFQAYRTPALSKAYRLASRMYRLGILPAHDLWNAGVSVDSALMGLAVRYGLVGVDVDLLERIAAGIPLDPWTDRVLREYVYAAYRMVSLEAGLDPFTLDEALRVIYERYCRYDLVKLDEKPCAGRWTPKLWVRDPHPPRGSWWD